MLRIRERLKIHDQFKFELKQVYPLDNRFEDPEYTAEMFLFLPQSLGVAEGGYAKEQFYRDLQSNIRWQTPSMRPTELLRDKDSLLAELTRLVENGSSRENLEIPEAETEEFLLCLKLFCSVVKSSLRDEVEFISANHTTTSLIDDFERDTSLLLRNFRKLRKTLSESPAAKKWLEFFDYGDEYTSLLAEYYWGKCANELRNAEGISRKLCKTLLKLAASELEYRKKRKMASVISAESSNEEAVYRMRALKKIMSSVLFLKAYRNADGRVTDQLVIAVAAGLAMLLAGIPAMFGRLLFTDLTFGFIFMAVIFYMVKDRLKELCRYYFLGITRRYFYDYDTRIVDGDGKTVGMSKELFNFVKEGNLPPRIRELRHRSEFVGQANGSGEVVLYYKKHIRLRRPPANQLRRLAKFDGIVDILRMNVSALLCHMDNPNKTLLLPSADGMKTVAGHTVYHVNVVLHYHSLLIDEYRKLRLILDRDGIVRIEQPS